MIIRDKSGLSYELNQNDYTAKIVESPAASGNLFIPRSIKHDTKYYSITTVAEKSFLFNLSIKSVYFSEDSEVETIEKEAFYGSSLENIFIPPNVTTIGELAFSSCESLQSVSFSTESKLRIIERELFKDSSIRSLYIPRDVKKFNKGWCKRTDKLVNVIISHHNNNFVYSEDKKLILGKISESSENYEVLIFANRDIEEATIPSNIKIISSYSFSDCEKLKEIKFTEDSQLFSIDEDAFFCSSIKSLFIPQKVSILQEGWCNRTPELTSISISSKNNNFLYLDNKMIISKSDKNLDYFDELIFVRRDVKNISIPSFIKYIESFAFTECKQLETINFSEDSELLSIECEAFCLSSIKSIKIPKKVQRIGEGSFSYCKKLSKVEFADDSELSIIDREAFCCSSLKTITLPRHVTEIVNCAFKFSDIHEIEFFDDSDLHSIKAGAFYDSLIEKIFLPSNVDDLDESWCEGMHYLKEVSVSPNNKRYSSMLNDKIIVGKSDAFVEFYDELIFASRDIEYCFVPKNFKCIKAWAFENCKKLKKFEFETDSELCEIGKNAFSNSAIQSILIPRFVSTIQNSLFEYCFNLRSIELSADELYIDLLCFYSSNNNIVFCIPNAKELKIIYNDFVNNFRFFISVDANISYENYKKS